MVNPATENVKVDPKLPVNAEALQPVRVTPVIPAKSVPKGDLEQIWLWYGSKRECPFYNLSLGGVCFAREIHQTRKGAEGTPDQLVPLDGNFHPIAKYRLEEIKESVARTVLRIGGGRAEVWDVKSDNYIADANDVPAGRFIYMQIVKAGQPFDRRAENAPPMA
jgi:hypothetical protein